MTLRLQFEVLRICGLTVLCRWIVRSSRWLLAIGGRLATYTEAKQASLKKELGLV